VAEAADGREALKQARAFKPDLVLMDLIMPVMDGFQATRKIRKLKKLKNVVVIALSASVFEHNRQQSLEAGCDDFIPKPVRAETLLKKLKNHLRLKWVYDVQPQPPAKPAKSDTAAHKLPLEGPPHAESEKLQELAKMGDIRGILQELDQLEKVNSQLQPFVQRVRELAREYNMKKVREFLKPYLK
jgi:CheY-like chemotaxis protein